MPSSALEMAKGDKAMSLKLSDGFKAALAGGMGYYDILKNGVVEMYTGAQPTTANDAPTGTKLATITLASGAYTPETRGTATIALTGITTAETITSITVGGLEILGSTVTYATSADATASALAAAINANRGGLLGFKAVYTSGDSFILYAPKNSGIQLNTSTLVASGTAIAAQHFYSGGVQSAASSPHTYSSGNGRFASGAGGNTAGVAATNGLTFTFPSTNVLSLSGVWSGLGTAAGTVGWARVVCRNRNTGAADSGAADASYLDMRLDCTVGTSAATAEMVVPSLTVSVGATQTINSFALTIGG